MKVCIIPAKGNSQRIPRKNLRPLFGRPIMAYSIDTARRCGLFDRIIVSTDDEEAAKVARGHGAEVMMRSPALENIGTQELGSIIVKRLCDRDKTPRHVCVLYATAPLLLPSDLGDGLLEMAAQNALYAYAVHETTLEHAGAYYWGEGWAFLHEIPLVGPRTVMMPLPDERVVDVNTEIDWRECERKYAALHPECARS